ncbi:hypothetical protein [Herbaspirillum sp. RV1423]|uniref:hypothetical protein n=1 Tax=Herbaspirillum sp. RV1423 TaxID=1443993 RepID=UPI0012DEBEEE|nr:hypothetical protein [Herbaspirillum sp. RV1423]
MVSIKIKAFFIVVFTFFVFSSAWASEVTIAGFAFAGDFKSAAERFPYTYKLFNRASDENKQNLSQLINQRIKGVKNASFDLKTADNMIALRNSDRALMSVLVLTGETVSTESFGAYYKTFINLRGDALIFDYKNQVIVSSAPVSVVLFDATPDKPAESRILAFVEDLIRRDDGRGLISQYVRRMETAALPENSSKTLQVKKGEIAPEALALLPEALRNDVPAVEAMLADSFGSILSAKLGLSMLPASIGHAVGGVMSMRLENGDDYKLKLGEGDYLFELKLNKFAKIKTAENNVSTAYVYGAYMSMRFFEPALNTIFMETDLKNGESAVVPAGLVSMDDFAAYQDAIRGLFLKFADAVQQPGSKWIATAASAKNIDTQMELVRKTLRNCK